MMIEWLIWIVVALIVIGVVLYIVKGYVVPALPAPLQNAVMALVALICLVVLLVAVFYGHVPGRL